MAAFSDEEYSKLINKAADRLCTHDNIFSFIREADIFKEKRNFPLSAATTLARALCVMEMEEITLAAKQMMEIMNEFESAAVALRFGSNLPPSLVLQLRDQMEEIKKKAFEWVAELAEVVLGLREVEVTQVLNDVKTWLTEVKESPDKDAIEIDSQRLMEFVKKVPLDRFPQF